MITIPVELVILAIQAGVKLYSGLREAYAASIKEAAITLPLPRVKEEGLQASPGVIAAFITDESPALDHDLIEDFQRQREVLLPIAEAINAGQVISEEQHYAAVAFRMRWLEIIDPPDREVKEVLHPTAASNEAVLAMLSIRQWTPGQDGAPIPWQIALGTVVDVAVLWFANDPGAISTSRPEGKALKAFLQAMQNVDFAHARRTRIVTDTMVAVLDTVAANPGLITNGIRETALIKATTKNLGKAIQAIPQDVLDDLDTNALEKVSFIAQSLAAATLRAGAETVLENPALFEIVDGAAGPETKVVQQVGKVFLDLVLPVDVAGHAKIDVARAVSTKGFETMVRATLAAVGNNPGILHLDGETEKRLSPLLAELFTAFSKAEVPTTLQAAFADTAAIVITATDRHMDTLWPDNSLDPRENLARGAVITVLNALAGVAAGTSGLSVFTTDDMIQLTDAVVDSVATNPRLMDALPGNDTYLKLALSGMLKALSDQSVGKLSAADAVVIVAAGVEAAVLNQLLLKEVTAGSIVLKAVLETVFEALKKVKTIGSDAAKWRATGTALQVGLVEAAFDVVAALPEAKLVTEDKLKSVEAALVAALTEGKPLDQLGETIARILTE